MTARKPDPLALLFEWAAIRKERRSVPPAGSIRQCEKQDERSEGPCYGRGQLFYGLDSCDPCRERLARFNRIKNISARLRGVEARLLRAAEKREEGERYRDAR